MYLASTELASVAVVLGKLPTVEEYMVYAKQIDSMSADIYRHTRKTRKDQIRRSRKTPHMQAVAATH